MKSIKLNLHSLLLSLSMLLIAVIIKTSVADYTSSDSHLALLTSQAILEKGTINLESYRTSVPESDFSGKWQYTVDEKTHKTLYFYPLGTPLLSIPIVLVANACGWDMLKKEDDTRMQFIIATLLCILIFYLLYSIGCSFVNQWTSLFLSITMFLGSTLISAMGTALWSLNFEIVFILMTIKEVINAEKGNKPRVFLIAIYLTVAWVCRPSALSLIAVIGCWILIKHRVYLVTYFLGTALILVPFFIFTYSTYGKIIPDYYNPFTWKHIYLGSFYFNVLMYVLFSPMRGLFTFTPILLLAFSGIFISSLKKDALYLILCFHFVLHTLMLVTQPDWYGGWCFGPRLYTDIVPSLIIMIFMVIKSQQPISNLNKSWIVALLAAGVFVHTSQGMYNKSVHSWNASPDLGEGLGFLCWNWRFPQFLASERSNELKRKVYNLEHEISYLISKTPNNATLLYLHPNESVKEYLHQWNRDFKFTSNQVYNSIGEIKLNNKKVFWFPASLLDEVKKDTSCTIIYPPKNSEKEVLYKAIFNQWIH